MSRELTDYTDYSQAVLWGALKALERTHHGVNPEQDDTSVRRGWPCHDVEYSNNSGDLKPEMIHFLLVACLSQVTGEAGCSWSMGEHGLLPGSDTRICAHVSLVRASRRPHLSSTEQECISSHGKGTENQ